MTYTLYGDLRSSSCTIEMALAEIVAEYVRIEVDLDADAQRGEAYRAVNPAGKLPALVLPDGTVVTESAAILLTLCDRHPEAGLLPQSKSPERARAYRWLAFVASEMYPMIEINDYPERFAPDPASAPAVRALARTRLRHRWGVVEAAIAGDPWLMASGFTIVDAYVANVSEWAEGPAWRAANCPKVDAIVAAVARRPALAPVWRRHFPDSPG